MSSDESIPPPLDTNCLDSNSPNRHRNNNKSSSPSQNNQQNQQQSHRFVDATSPEHVMEASRSNSDSMNRHRTNTNNSSSSRNNSMGSSSRQDSGVDGVVPLDTSRTSSNSSSYSNSSSSSSNNQQQQQQQQTQQQKYASALEQLDPETRQQLIAQYYERLRAEQNQQQQSSSPPQNSSNNKFGMLNNTSAAAASSQQNNQQQQHQEEEEDIHFPPYVGLVNQGCTCYLSSLLQCLYHTPAFRSAVYSIDTQKDDIDAIPKAIQSLFYSLETAAADQENQVGEAQATSVLTDSFGWGREELSVQHDINELMLLFSSALEPRLHGEVTLLFSGLGEKFIRCLDDSHTSRRREVAGEFILQVEGFKDIYSSIDSLLAVDQLTGSNKYKLELPGKEAEYKDAEIGYRYLRFPPVLFFHLKRFAMDMTSPTLETKKINSAFVFPKTLDLSSKEYDFFVTEDDIEAAGPDASLRQGLETAREQQRLFPQVYGNPDNSEEKDAVYELYAVLIHTGGVHHGHYTCNIRDFVNLDELSSDEDDDDEEEEEDSQTASAATTASNNNNKKQQQHHKKKKNKKKKNPSLQSCWYNFDDEIVTEVPEDIAIQRTFGGYSFVRGHQVLSTRNAYMLCYVRKSLIPQLFKPISAQNALPDCVKAEFAALVQEEQRLATIEAEKNSLCHITLFNDDSFRSSVSQQKFELLEPDFDLSTSAPGTSAAFQIPKHATMSQLYDVVGKLVQLPSDGSAFRLHWYCPATRYGTHYRVSTLLNRTNRATIESTCPVGIAGAIDRPWFFKMYVEYPSKIPYHVQTNAARFGEIRVSSGIEQLDTMNDPVPAMPLVDNRVFVFEHASKNKNNNNTHEDEEHHEEEEEEEADIEAKFEIRFKKVHSIQGICFTAGKRTDNQFVTRYSIRCIILKGTERVAEYVFDHQRHTQHSVFFGTHMFDPPVKGDRVFMQRCNVNCFNMASPNNSYDPEEVGCDPLLISRLKIIVPPRELPQQLDVQKVEPRFLSKDIRCYYTGVKFYNWRTNSLEYVGHVSLPISEYIDASLNVLRHLCDLPEDTPIELFAEEIAMEGGVLEKIDLSRPRIHISITLNNKQVGRDRAYTEQLLIVQESPPENLAFLYRHPFVDSWLEEFREQRKIYLFNYRQASSSSSSSSPEQQQQMMMNLQGQITVPAYSTHDMVAEAVAAEVGVQWDRLRLYGCREAHISREFGRIIAFPLKEPLRSDTCGSVQQMLSSSRGAGSNSENQSGILFYEVLTKSLREAESVVRVVCTYNDALGEVIEAPSYLNLDDDDYDQNQNETPKKKNNKKMMTEQDINNKFDEEVSCNMSMSELAETILDFYGFPFERPHVFLDIQQGMIEDYVIVTPSSHQTQQGGSHHHGSSSSSSPSGANSPTKANEIAASSPSPSSHSGIITQPAKVAGTVGNKPYKNLEKFFRGFSENNRRFELRVFPEASAHEEAYCVAHGYFHEISRAVDTTVSQGNSNANNTNSKIPPPCFIMISLKTTVLEAKDLIMKRFNLKEEDLQPEADSHYNYQLQLLTHRALHFCGTDENISWEEGWDTLLKDYFGSHDNVVMLSRPKCLFMNHKHEKEKPGSLYRPQNAPQLKLTSLQDKKKKEQSEKSQSQSESERTSKERSNSPEKN